MQNLKVIDLKSKGTISLSGDFNWFGLPMSDKIFIESILTLLQEYESSEALRAAGLME